jgi:hypothetical protein
MSAVGLPDGGAVLWLLPIVVIALVYFSPKHFVSADTAVTALVGLGVVAMAARWPDRSLIILIALLPFQGLLLAKLWAWGFPTSIVRHLGAWKETLALGVVIAGAHNFIASGRRADALDRLGLGFVAIAGLYLAAQHTIIPSAPSASSIRLLGFREDAGFVLLLLGARHANLPAEFLERAGRAVLVVAAVVAGIGIFEALDSSGWNRFVVNTIQYTHYQYGVLHITPPNYHDIRFYGTIGGTQIIRIGSVLLNALSLGFYLVLGFAVGLERAASGRARPWVMISMLMIVVALLLTQTRSAILAALIVAFLALQPAAGHRRHWRAQLALVLAAIALVAIPTALATGLSQRVAGPTNNADNANHVSGFWNGLSTVGHHPLGQGLGTSAGTGERFASQVSQVVVAENNYLQIGDELGVVPMLLFVGLTAAVVLSVRAAARRNRHYLLGAAGGAMAGLAVGAWFLHTWTDFSVAWSVWGVAGAALGVRRVSAKSPEAMRNAVRDSPSSGPAPAPAGLASGSAQSAMM